MGDEMFRTDLFRGTAEHYDRWRPPYPIELLDDVRQRVPVSRTGRLLDLACGTGQLAIPLAADFREVLAVDQEPDAIGVARQKASRLGIDNVKWITGGAETVQLDGTFELVTIGNAFHRLRRDVVARRLWGHMETNACLALVWGGTPWRGDRPWQRCLQSALEEWTARLDANDRNPLVFEAAMAADPHRQVLERSGFSYETRLCVDVDREWTMESLLGFVASTSFLNERVVASRREEFEADLTARMLSCNPSGSFVEHTTYACDLARKLAV